MSDLPTHARPGTRLGTAAGTARLRACAWATVAAFGIACTPAARAQGQPAAPGQAPVRAPVERTPSAGAATAGSLIALFDAALQRDPSVRAAEAAVASATESLASAEGRLKPQVGLTGSQFLSSSVSRSTSAGKTTEIDRTYPNTSVSLSARYPILNLAQRADIRAAQSRLLEAQAQAVQARQQMASRLVEGWFEHLLAQEFVRLADVQIVSSRARLQGAQRALAAGEGTRTDIDDAQARLDLDTFQRLAADQMKAAARLRILQLAGAEPLDGRALEAEAAGFEWPEPGSLDDWQARAESNSAELRVMQARVDAADAAVEQARARLRPTLDAVAQVGLGKSDDLNRLDTTSSTASVGVQFNMPLYTGGSFEAAERQAAADRRRAAEALEAVRLELRLRLMEQHRALVEARARGQALRQVLRSAAQALQSSQQSVKAGTRTQLDVLDAEQRLATARRDLAQAGQAALLASFRLELLAGLMDAAVLGRLDARIKVVGPGIRQ